MFTALGIEWILGEGLEGFGESKTLDINIGSVFRSALSKGLVSWTTYKVPGNERLLGPAEWKIMTC